MVRMVSTIYKFYHTEKNLKPKMLKNGRITKLTTPQRSKERNSLLDPWLLSVNSTTEKLLSWEVVDQMKFSCSTQRQRNRKRLLKAALKLNT